MLWLPLPSAPSLSLFSKGSFDTEAMCCPARGSKYKGGDTSDLTLSCGGTISFTKSFVYLGSLLHYDLSDHHDAGGQEMNYGR